MKKLQFVFKRKKNTNFGLKWIIWFKIGKNCKNQNIRSKNQNFRQKKEVWCLKIRIIGNNSKLVQNKTISSKI